ncbi:MAG: type II toxin-antitoxin system VapC family toxin [Polyangiaceae bacterium]
MSVERVTYLDSSAIVKLVVAEAESASLLRYLQQRRTLLSSALARTEVMRACLSLGASAQQRVDSVLGRIDLVRVSDRVLTLAGELHPPTMRSLDAIHLATASLLGKESVARLVTYDTRMAAAARALGFSPVAPA